MRQWLCGRVRDWQSRGCGFESQPGLLRTKVYSAFHPSGVSKWVPAAAGKAKVGLAHSDCGWTCGFAGKTVKSLENTCHTWARLRWWFTKKMKGKRKEKLINRNVTSELTGQDSSDSYWGISECSVIIQQRDKNTATVNGHHLRHDNHRASVWLFPLQQ